MKPTHLFLSCEHAVNHIPSDYQTLFQANTAILETHRAIDIGALEIATHLSQTLSCDNIQASVSRLLIDCNRSLTHKHCFSEFTNTLSPIEKQRLIDQYYLPYRQQGERAIEALITKGYQVLHLSCHSFVPVFKGIKRDAAIGLLYDPKRHGEKEVAREWRSLLVEQLDAPIRFNYPYLGSSDGFTTALRKKHSEKDYLGIELEVNQSWSVDKPAFKNLLGVLSDSLRELLALLS